MHLKNLKTLLQAEIAAHELRIAMSSSSSASSQQRLLTDVSSVQQMNSFESGFSKEQGPGWGPGGAHSTLQRDHTTRCPNVLAGITRASPTAPSPKSSQVCLDDHAVSGKEVAAATERQEVAKPQGCNFEGHRSKGNASSPPEVAGCKCKQEDSC